MNMTIFSKARFTWQLALFALGIVALMTHLIFRWIDTVYANWPLLAMIFIGAIPILWQIGRKIYHRDFGADILAAISIVAAVILEEYLASVLVIMMMAGGQALESFALSRASSVLRTLAERMPARIRRRVGDLIEDIDLSEIKIGDMIVIAPHETSPIDGIVMEGQSHMDESYLTGEPYRVAKTPGASVLSGAINGESVVIVQTSKLPKDSRYAQIIKVMQDAENNRPYLRRLGDQLGAIFAPIALLVAACAWIYSGDPSRFLAVLVVATPCPLLIAIPVAIISAISVAAARGIIIKDPMVLERLPTCRTAIFDKTGTLTYGQPQLSDIDTADSVTKEQVLQKVASLEQYSKHPLAQAVLKATKDANLTLKAATSISEIPGQGLWGMIDHDQVEVTSRKHVLRKYPSLMPSIPPTSSGLECIILINQTYAATLRFHDMPRKFSRSFVHHLAPYHSFRKIMLVSGDRESEVAYLAKLLGIENALSSQSPEQKLQIVRREVEQAPTLFMGDGINDAPALKAATVGVAFGDPTIVTREAAGAVVMNSTLAKLDELLHISKDMRIIAMQSAVGGIFLSFIGMALAALGYLPPVAGALVQQAIDALAILNALRLSFKPEGKIDLPLNE